MLESQKIMRGEGFNPTFDVTDVDRVSYDSKYAQNQLQGFLWGKPESDRTYANHNEKSVRWVSC